MLCNTFSPLWKVVLKDLMSEDYIIRFKEANTDFEPICLINKDCELIKYDYAEKCT